MIGNILGRSQEMVNQMQVVLVLAGLAAMFMGCSGQEFRQTEFLSDYSRIEAVSSSTMRYMAPGGTIAKYSIFIVDPVVVQLSDPAAGQSLDPKDIQHLQQFFYAELCKRLSQRYSIVTQPGFGIARIRIAITNLKPSDPGLRTVPPMKMAGLGLGAVSAEMEMLDSQTGEQIAAVIESSEGNPFGSDGSSKWGDVEAIMTQWGNRIVDRIQEAHGITK
jgi:hypothetical protein